MAYLERRKRRSIDGMDFVAPIRRCVLFTLTLALLLLPGTSHAGTVTDPGFADTAVATGLSQPTALAFLPDGRMLVTQKGGALVLVDGQTKQTLITLSVCSGSEMGLLGVAVDPGFAGNGFIYLYRTKPGAGGCGTSTGRFNQVVRVTLAGSTVDPASLVELLSGIRTDNGNHDGGTLRIGPDNKLWVSVGDTGVGDINGPPGSSTNPYSQDLGSLEGKILRLELSGSPAVGNPFLSTPGARGEIYARGFRNPFRMGFDPQTGKLWVGDVGQNNFEELDIVQSGGNYAWPRCEGTEPPGCMQAGDVAPIYTYQIGTLGRSVIGGDFARAGFGPYEGQYFFGDNSASAIYRATVNAARDDVTTVQSFVTSAGGPADVVFGPGPALYYTALNTGEVRQVAIRYPRPGGATPLVVPLAPAFLPCTAPNSTHVGPLDNPSCTPPVEQSGSLTMGTAGRGSGSSRLSVVPGDPGHARGRGGRAGLVGRNRRSLPGSERGLPRRCRIRLPGQGGRNVWDPPHRHLQRPAAEPARDDGERVLVPARSVLRQRRPGAGLQLRGVDHARHACAGNGSRGRPHGGFAVAHHGQRRGTERHRLRRRLPVRMRRR